MAYVTKGSVVVYRALELLERSLGGNSAVNQ